MNIPMTALAASALALAGAALTDDCSGTSPSGKPTVLDHDPLFYVDNPFLTPIGEDPEIDPDSDAYVAKMVSIVATGGLIMPINTWTHPLFYADETTPRYDVGLTVYGTYGYCGKVALLDVPIPDFAEADPESDAHMIVVDRDRGCVYDFWGYDPNPLVEAKTSWWASAIPLDGDGIYHGSVGAGFAAGFSTAQGAVWPDEIAAGRIEHALTFSYGVPGVRASDPVPPATHSDGTSTDPDAIPEGTRLQLDPELDLDSLGLLPHERVVARALQEYGMVLSDVSGGGVRFAAISGLSADPNPWVGVVPDGTANSVQLGGIPVDRLRVLKIPATVPGPGGCQDNRCQTYR